MHCSLVSMTHVPVSWRLAFEIFPNLSLMVIYYIDLSLDFLWICASPIPLPRFILKFLNLFTTLVSSCSHPFVEQVTLDNLYLLCLH